MKSTPRPLSMTTARRPSSGVEIAIAAGNCDFGPSSIGPEMIMRGPSSAPLATSRRAARIGSRSLPMSRTPVIPLAMKSGSVTSLPPGTQSPKNVWMCMSQRPGMRNFPFPSTARAPFGIFVLPDSPTAAMRSPSMTTVMFGFVGPPVVSMTVTLVMAMGPLASSDRASRAPAHDNNPRTTTRRIFMSR